MKNIYLVQANAIYGDKVKNTYIPHAIGCLAAFAFSDERIKKEYNLGKFIYTRKDIDEAVKSMDNPFLVGFSCSVWNSEYNKALSKAVKKAYPGCITLFGGHHLPPDAEILFREFPDCDIAVHGGGEEAFKAVLEAYMDNKDLSGISNISYKTKEGIFTGPSENPTLPDYPSPYLMGIYDPILNDGIEFSAIIETNRGCPNHCAFCDWGILKHKVRLFSLDKVYAELKWLSDHKIEYVYCADANFGLFSRDMEITDKFIELKKTTGYPKKLKVNFTKNRCDFVGAISKKLCDNGMGKSQTLSFQSVDKTVLEIIGRKNISLDYFRQLLHFYAKAGIPTYSELILGLPGETYESFTDGLCALIENGQHKSINIYPCELLPNSQLGSKEYVEKYKIKTTKLPFLQFHCEKDENEKIPEYSNLITETSVMSRQDWVNTYFFAVLIQSFHCLDITRETAIYMREIHSMPYKKFYSGLMDYAFSHENSYIGKIFKEVKNHLNELSLAKSPICFYDNRFGLISFEPDEYMFLSCIYDSDKLYKDILGYVKTLTDDNTAAELTRYQKAILNLPGKEDFTETFPCDFPDIFEKAEEGEKTVIDKKETRIKFTSPKKAESWKEYAVECVWYGRRNEGMHMKTGRA